MTSLLGSPADYKCLPDVLCYIFLHNQEFGIQVLEKANIKLDPGSEIPQPYGAADFSSEYAELKRFCKFATETAITILAKQPVLPCDKEAITSRSFSKYVNPFQKRSVEMGKETYHKAALQDEVSAIQKAQEKFKEFLVYYCRKV